MHVPDMGVHGCVRGYTRGMDERMLSSVSRRTCLQLRSGSGLQDIQTIPIRACNTRNNAEHTTSMYAGRRLNFRHGFPDDRDPSHFQIAPVSTLKRSGPFFALCIERALHYLGFRNKGKKITKV